MSLGQIWTTLGNNKAWGWFIFIVCVCACVCALLYRLAWDIPTTLQKWSVKHKCTIPTSIWKEMCASTYFGTWLWVCGSVTEAFAHHSLIHITPMAPRWRYYLIILFLLLLFFKTMDFLKIKYLEVRFSTFPLFISSIKPGVCLMVKVVGLRS